MECPDSQVPFLTWPLAITFLALAGGSPTWCHGPWGGGAQQRRAGLARGPGPLESTRVGAASPSCKVGSWKLRGPVLPSFSVFSFSSLSCSLRSVWKAESVFGAFCFVCWQIGRVSARFPLGANPLTTCAQQPLVGIVCTLKRVNSCYRTKTIYVRRKCFCRSSFSPLSGTTISLPSGLLVFLFKTIY